LPVLVSCTKKNLATLPPGPRRNVFHISDEPRACIRISMVSSHSKSVKN
jgi:hypothetical protein